MEGLLGPIGYIDLVDKNEASARTALLTGVERKRRKPASAPTFPPVAHAEAEQPAFPGGLLDVGKPHPQPARFGLPFPELWNVPRRHSIFFTGRGRLLDQQARAIREQQLGLRHPETAATLDGLARLYRVQGKYEQAEQLYRQALKIWQQVLASTHPRIANSLHNLALLYADWGRYEQAEVLYQQSLAILMPGERKVVGELLSFTR